MAGKFKTRDNNAFCAVGSYILPHPVHLANSVFVMSLLNWTGFHILLWESWEGGGNKPPGEDETNKQILKSSTVNNRRRRVTSPGGVRSWWVSKSYTTILVIIARHPLPNSSQFWCLCVNIHTPVHQKEGLCLALANRRLSQTLYIHVQVFSPVDRRNPPSIAKGWNWGNCRIQFRTNAVIHIAVQHTHWKNSPVIYQTCHNSK